jgi:hypothetical protein
MGVSLNTVNFPTNSAACPALRVAPARGLPLWDEAHLAVDEGVEAEGGLSTQIDLDVAQRLAVGQLCKGHGQELIHAGEILNLVIAAVSGHASTESTQWQNGMSCEKTSLPWFIAVLCVQTQKTISHGV